MDRPQNAKMGVSMACLAAVLSALIMLPIALTSQSSSKTPTIRVVTRLVRVGLIVRDAKGSPVAGLKEKDFAVFDEGKPQKISFFGPGAVVSSAPAMRSLPPGTFSDLPRYAKPPRSVTIVLLDNLNTFAGSAPESQYEATPYWLEDLALANAKAHLTEFIKNLDPRDRVAIYGLGDTLHVLSDFTNDRAQLLAILKKYNTRSKTNRDVVEPTFSIGPKSCRPDCNGFENGYRSRLAGMANEDRGQITMAALRAIAAHVAHVPGRKNLVWLTANLPFSGAAMAQVLSPADIAAYPIDARGLLARSPMVMADVHGTADADEVAGVVGTFGTDIAKSSQPIGIATMKQLAQDTGGQAFVNTNNLTGAIRKAVENSAVTYNLGFYLDPARADGKFHALKVEVKKSGLSLFYPKGYFAYKNLPVTKQRNWTNLVTAVQSPIEAFKIRFLVKVSRINRPKPKSLSIQGSVDVRDLHLAETGNMRKGGIAVDFVEQDATGKVANEVSHASKVEFTPGQYAAILKSGMHFRQLLQPKPNVTTLRVVVEDLTTSKVGSVIIPLSQVH